MRIGIVCEGSTDFAVLRGVCTEILGRKDLSISLLQPRFDALAGRAGGAPGPGWQGVRSFLRQAGPRLGAAPQDVIVVHVDADIRHLPEIKKQLGESADGEDLAPLCDHVKSWMAGSVPESVVIVLPREAIEAWLCAVATRRADVERIEKPAEDLRSAGVLGTRGEVAEKLASTYAMLAERLGPLLRDRRALSKVPELARFAGKLAVRAKSVRSASRRGREQA
jgi:hypothetical protein